jgi:hypothetical protein
MRRLCLRLAVVLCWIAPWPLAAEVVVVPLGGGRAAEPFAPLAATDPSVDTYGVSTLQVTDATTGLIWERYGSTGAMNWETAWSYCQGRNTGGWQTWRLPGIDDLQSLVYYGTHSPAINSLVFIDTESDGYWSGTTLAGDPTAAWFVHFNNGAGTYHVKTEAKYARCVRGPSVLHHRYVDEGNGTVEDLSTGLVWQAQDDGAKRWWNEAETYCQELSLGARTDWRLPSVKELRSIVELRTMDPAIELLVFPATASDGYWTATASDQYAYYVWQVDFNTGVSWESEATNAAYAKEYVRCVRP